MNPTDLITQEPFKSLFPIKDQTLGAIAATMMQSGYDPAYPIIVWKHKNIVVDGHTRLLAAIAAGIEDVPVVEHDFPSEDVAVRYAIDCQRNRRNITDADIIRLVQELDKRRQAGRPKADDEKLAQPCANSKSATDTAEAIGISTRKVEQARSVIDKATPEVKAAVEAGDMTINAASKTVNSKASTSTPSPSVEDGAGTVPAEPATQALRKIGPPCDGMQFARMAIMDLEQIKTNDTERKKAFSKVKDWIFENSDPSFLICRWGDRSELPFLKRCWNRANKTDREKFLQWVDKERCKDLPKSTYQDARKVALKLRRMLKNADAGTVNTVMQELDLGGGESWLK